MRLNHLSKHFWLSDWGIYKTWILNVAFSFYFLHAEITLSHSMPSQDYTANGSSNRCFEYSKMQFFELLMCFVLNFCCSGPISVANRGISVQPYCRLLFTFEHIRINLQFITCHDNIDVFRSNANIFLKHFLRPINLFLATDNLWGKQIFLTVKYSCNIQCMLVPLMLKVIWISR